MKKRIISLALVLIMMFTLVPTMALADTAEVSPSIEHNWDNGTVTKAATCTKEGSMLYTCTDDGCGETKTESIPATGHHYVDKIVKPTYTEGGYTLRACSDCGKEKKVDATEMKALKKPASVTATGSYTTVKLKWDKVSGADGYYVYQATSKSGTYKKVATVSTNSATLKSKTLGKTYYYKIKAYNNVQKSSYSSIVSVKILPKAPVIDTTVSSTSSTIKISWSEISHASGYYVYRKTTDGSWAKVAKVKGKSNTSYKDTGVSGKYYYAVVAYKTVDGTTYSSVKSDSIKTRTLKKTSAINCLQYTDTFKAKISWKSVSGASKYQIAYKAGSNEWKSLGYTTDLSKNKTQTHGVNYLYRVRAIYESGGVTTYGPYYAMSDGYILSYPPEYTVTMEAVKDGSKAFGSVLYITNAGSQKMRVYAKDAVMLYYNSDEEAKSKYDRDLTIVDKNALENGETKCLKYVDIPAGESRYVIFIMNDSLIDDTAKPYTDNCVFCYNFKYDNVDYVGFSCINVGNRYV